MTQNEEGNETNEKLNKYRNSNPKISNERKQWTNETYTQIANVSSHVRDFL